MRRISFRVPAGEKEQLLDALMPLLPAGVHESGDDAGDVELASVAAVQPGRALLEAAAGRPLAGWTEEDVPADWRRRRARFGGGGFLVAGRLHILSFTDRDAAAVHFVAKAELRLPSAA